MIVKYLMLIIIQLLLEAFFCRDNCFRFLKNSKNRGNIYFNNCNVKGIIVLKSNDINFCLRQKCTLGINNSESNIIVEKDPIYYY